MIHGARLYDVSTQILFGGRRGRFYDRLIRPAALQPGQRVLDIGCGSGALTDAVARRVGPTGSVLGIDPAPEMVEFCRGRAAPSTRFEVMSAEHLALEDASFDVVVSMAALHHIGVDQRAEAVGEIFRVLRPGGLVMIADFSFRPGSHTARVIGLLTGPGTHRDNLDEAVVLVRQAGFRDVRTGRAGPLIGRVTAVRP